LSESSLIRKEKIENAQNMVHKFYNKRDDVTNFVNHDKEEEDYDIILTEKHNDEICETDEPQKGEDSTTE
jgi:hypothetical protein